jgi:hypothetical protein
VWNLLSAIICITEMENSRSGWAGVGGAGKKVGIIWKYRSLGQQPATSVEVLWLRSRSILNFRSTFLKRRRDFD